MKVSDSNNIFLNKLSMFDVRDCYRIEITKFICDGRKPQKVLQDCNIFIPFTQN